MTLSCNSVETRPGEQPGAIGSDAGNVREMRFDPTLSPSRQPGATSRPGEPSLRNQVHLLPLNQG
jgi:hypothetical protein